MTERLLLLLPALARATLIFDGVAHLGDYYLPKPPARRDPHSTINFGPYVLANANGTTWGSLDGGSSWERQTSWGATEVSEQTVAIKPNTRMGFAVGRPAYYQNATDSFAWQEQIYWTVDEEAKEFSRTIVRGPQARKVTVSGLPFKTYELALLAGGVAQLPSGKFVASATLWGSPAQPPFPQPPPGRAPGPCCNNSVGIFVSEDGYAWKFASVVAHKKDIAGSQEGPNESTLAVLKDGSLLVIFRVDGGDGTPDEPHKPYMMARSTDGGSSWSRPTSLPAGVMSAKPVAAVLADGTLVLSGGRPALNLWESSDGFGRNWTSYDIPTEHNRLVGPRDAFCKEFERADLALGWAESSAYTTLMSTAAHATREAEGVREGKAEGATGLVCYERQGGRSGGYKQDPPPQCDPSFSSIFCMRLHAQSAEGA
jgi:hypothetical protein